MECLAGPVLSDCSLGVVLTALYMTRQMIYVFFGRRRARRRNTRTKAPGVMTLPLVVLALCVIGFSVVLTPAWPWLDRFLSGEPATLHFAQLIQPGIYLALATGRGRDRIWEFGCIGKRLRPIRWSARAPAVFRFLENRMWLDELYDWTVLALARFAALAC